MLKITFITVGEMKEAYLRAAFAEYEKRMGRYCSFSEINIKEAPVHNEERAAEIAAALTDEGRRIIAAVPRGAFAVAATPDGREYSSPEFARFISDAAQSCGAVVFIVGSSHGLSDEVYSVCRARFSMSRLTFPHQLARVMLSEAVYRALSILNNSKYHK